MTAAATPACHACDQPATQQWQRQASDDEAAQYHANMNTWRKTQGLPPMPDTAAIRQTPVLVAVFGCDDHGPDETTGKATS